MWAAKNLDDYSKEMKTVLILYCSFMAIQIFEAQIW